MPARTFKARFWAGTSDAALRFAAMRGYLRDLRFRERIKGSHHIFTRPGIEEIINLLAKGSRCKPYRVAQVRRILARHGLR